MKIILRKNKLPIIKSSRLVLRDIQVEDISPEYVKWLNDPETVRYLKIRFTPQTPQKILDYIGSKLKDIINTKHFGVYDKNGKRLVGTVTLPNINWHHCSADISFVIGHPDAQGRGYATEAVHAVCNYMFNESDLIKLWGGYIDGHKASARVFKKNGFQIEGRLRKAAVNDNNERVDAIYVGLLKTDFRAKEEMLGPLPPVKLCLTLNEKI